MQAGEGREGDRGGPTCHLTATLLIPRHFHDNCFKRVTAPVAPAWPDNAPPAARRAVMPSAADKYYFFPLQSLVAVILHAQHDRGERRGMLGGGAAAETPVR